MLFDPLWQPIEEILTTSTMAAMTNGHHNGVSGEEERGWSMSKPLQELDSEVYAIIQREKRRQTASLEMIARYAQEHP